MVFSVCCSSVSSACLSRRSPLAFDSVLRSVELTVRATAFWVSVRSRNAGTGSSFHPPLVSLAHSRRSACCRRAIRCIL